MKSRLKTALSTTALCLCTMLPVTFVSTAAFAQASRNWANSPQNWQNSPNNWKNNPNNWQNSSQNYSTNGIYDSAGNHTGYVVPSPNGGKNYFNNDGSRRAYQPGQ
jgi:hypothetical protein